MTNIAGQTRDEAERLHCPKCAAAMEQVSFGGTTVDRCVSCKGIWFDASEHERLKSVEGAGEIDSPPPARAAGNPVGPPPGKILCPVCHTPMIQMTDHEQPHIKYESCTVCYGVFFDAGEFRDYTEVTIAESVRTLFRRR
jgi:uncharacterized protein